MVQPSITFCKIVLIEDFFIEIIQKNRSTIIAVTPNSTPGASTSSCSTVYDNINCCSFRFDDSIEPVALNMDAEVKSVNKAIHNLEFNPRNFPVDEIDVM